MKPLHLALLCISLSTSACEVAELPPSVEVRDARDSTQADTTVAETTGDTAPDTVTDTAPDASPDSASSDTLEDTSLTDTTADDTRVDDTNDTAEDTESDTSDTSSDTSDPTEDTAPDTSPDTTTDTADTTSSCMPVVATHPIVASPHVTTCSAVSYETDPPSSGPHYPVWAAFKTYGVAINPGFLVHALEHGAIVISWRCDTTCASDLAALQAMLAQRAADPLCDPLVKHRIIVVPRPTQDVALAAWGWGATWKADCFDLASLSDFIDAWYAKGPENFCAQGVDIETILPDNAWYCPP